MKHLENTCNHRKVGKPNQLKIGLQKVTCRHHHLPRHVLWEDFRQTAQRTAIGKGTQPAEQQEAAHLE